MKTGVVLPTFTDRPDQAFAVARQAAQAGIDGVFCWDHLWPMGQPDRPALAPFPLLASIAASTEIDNMILGTLVARVGLVPDDVLVAQFLTLEALAPGRVVAGLGTGDRLSAAENEAYGVGFASADERRQSLRSCAQALSARSIPVWVGGGAAATMALAASLGVAVNLWSATAAEVAVQANRGGEVTWAGPTPAASGAGDRSDRLRTLVAEIGQAGASWFVLAWPAPLDALVEAAAAW